jgi:hypothetical protein
MCFAYSSVYLYDNNKILDYIEKARKNRAIFHMVEMRGVEPLSK